MNSADLTEEEADLQDANEKVGLLLKCSSIRLADMTAAVQYDPIEHYTGTGSGEKCNGIMPYRVTAFTAQQPVCHCQK